MSEEEIKRISLTEKLAIAFARVLKCSESKKEDRLSKDLAGQINALTSDLFLDDFGSEAAEPLQAIYLDVNFPGLTPENFARAMDLDFSNPAHQLARFVPAGNFWEDFIDMQVPGYRKQALDLSELMRANLKDIHIIIQGADQDGVSPEHPVFVVGLTDWGDILGFRSKVIWT